MLKLKNDGKTTLAADINSTVTSITVTDGSVFPALSVNEWFPLTLIKLSNIERMRVTAITGNVLTVVRGAEETTAQSWLTGDDCILALTAGGYKELQDSVYDLELGVSVEIGELKAIARSLNEPDENVGYSTAGLIVKPILYAADQQAIYSAPTGAIGKTILSLIANVLKTSDLSEYILIEASQRFTGAVNAMLFGAPVNGVDYDDEFVQIALDYAVSQGRSLYLPAGNWLFKAPTAESTASILFPESSGLDIEVFGDGDSTVITVEDNISHGFSYCSVFGNVTGMTPTLASPTRGGYGKVNIHDIKILGAWSTTVFDPVLGRFGRNLFGFSKLDHLTTKRVTVNNWQNKYSRGGFHKRYTAMFNTVDVCASDVFRAQESENVVISFNKVKNADDDAIAVHSESSVSNANSAARILIQGNIIEDSEGILCLGGKIVNISNNIISRSHGTCIAVLSFPASGEGAAPSHTVMIANNTITDPMVRADSGVFGVSNEAQSAIQVGRAFVSPLISGDVPSRPRANATFIPEYASGDGVSFMYSNSFLTDPTSGGTGISITGNLVQRTLPSSTNYNALGYGLYVDRFGEWNPVTNDECFLWSAISILNDVNNFNISMNTITSMYKSGIRLRHIDNPDDIWKMGLTNGKISGNTIVDCTQGVSSNVSEAVSAVNWTLDISGNTFDCDPWHKDPSRRIIGGWTLDTSISTLCTGIQTRNILGITANNNIFKNCYIPIKNHQTDSTDGTGYNGTGNVVFCKPVSAGFHTDNGGVGDVGFGSEYTHVVYETSPIEVDYGRIITNPNQAENAAPTTGTYVEGFFNSRGDVLSGGEADRRTGWLRATTGSQNVEGVDWKPLFAQDHTEASSDAALADITSGINIKDKYAGKAAFSDGRPVYSTGSTAGSVWNDALGVLEITPV